MPDPVWFVVERRMGGESPAIIYDRLPQRLTRKITPFEASSLVYAIRLDTLPDAEDWISRSPAALHLRYKELGTIL